MAEKSHRAEPTPEAEEAEVIRLEELAAWLRIAPSTVYRQIKAGKLPAFKVARDYRFNRTQIKEWILLRAAVSQQRKHRG